MAEEKKDVSENELSEVNKEFLRTVCMCAYITDDRNWQYTFPYEMQQKLIQLIKKGANVNVLGVFKDTSLGRQHLFSALHLAAQGNNPELIKFLVTMGADYEMTLQTTHDQIKYIETTQASPDEILYFSSEKEILSENFLTQQTFRIPDREIAMLNKLLESCPPTTSCRELKKNIVLSIENGIQISLLQIGQEIQYPRIFRDRGAKKDQAIAALMTIFLSENHEKIKKGMGSQWSQFIKYYKEEFINNCRQGSIEEAIKILKIKLFADPLATLWGAASQTLKIERLPDGTPKGQDLGPRGIRTAFNEIAQFLCDPNELKKAQAYAQKKEFWKKTQKKIMIGTVTSIGAGVGVGFTALASHIDTNDPGNYFKTFNGLLSQAFNVSFPNTKFPISAGVGMVIFGVMLCATAAFIYHKQHRTIPASAAHKNEEKNLDVTLT